MTSVFIRGNTGLVLASLALILAAGCSQKASSELAFRKDFKKTWDKTMTVSEQAKTKIEKAYGDGDVETVTAEYKSLSEIFGKSAEETKKLTTPEGYDELKRLTLAYYRAGGSYYAEIAGVVEGTGGNYGEEQEKAIKNKEKKWQRTTAALEKELKRKKFELE